MNPPFSPRSFDLDMEVVSQHLEPFESASDWDVSVHISGVHPDFVPSLHEDGVQVISGVLVHNVVILDVVIAWVPSFDEPEPLQIQVNSHIVVVEEVESAETVVTVHIPSESLGLQSHSTFFGSLEILIVARRVDIEDRSVGLGEAVVEVASIFNALVAEEAQGASSFEQAVFIFGIVSVFVQELVLE